MEKGGSPSMILALAVSAGKPPLSGKRCREHDHSGKISGSGRCHCKKRDHEAKAEEIMKQADVRTLDASPLEYDVKLEDVEAFFGQYAKVRICREKTTGHVYATKKLKKSEMFRRGQLQTRTQQEKIQHWQKSRRMLHEEANNEQPIEVQEKEVDVGQVLAEDGSPLKLCDSEDDLFRWNQYKIDT